MNTAFRIERRLLDEIHRDLSRPHPYAHERVGFIACAAAEVLAGTLLLAEQYLPLADEDYEDVPEIGAMMASSAIRKALGHAYKHKSAMLHVHRHDHLGTPHFSSVDLSESAKFVPDFFKVASGRPHGIVVLSFDQMRGLAWDPTSKVPEEIAETAVIGRPLSIFGKWWAR